MAPSINNAKCVLVTGATSGIGRALALAIAALPSRPKVIGVGRRKDRLAGLREAGIEAEEFDVNADRTSTKAFVERMIQKYPEIDTILLAAGVQREFNFKKEIDLDAIVNEMNVNYTAIVTMITFFMPHFLAKAATGQPCIIAPVTSALAYVSAIWVPNYSASKAALHSMCNSLRVQLGDTNISVIEISPPLVESELHDAEGTTEALSKFWMPLDTYTKETVEGLQRGENVVCCGQAKIVYEKFEQPKEQVISDMAKRSPSRYTVLLDLKLNCRAHRRFLTGSKMNASVRL
ncbi:hypothetical protein GYMLUDRAFT_167102 [Collybiopsis luxurians FD-317 M1]|uniref:NAD(P)-binding protein n=1 Tax=Collybiopsis luxurians FD-317 M1 TaxID=944289 RepID=A0A0D0CPY3_9AGAR|nr:hypothetical protein GYMLUDRAFT_167102 [Collybiopsis luxurians FD-317 M1]